LSSDLTPSNASLLKPVELQNTSWGFFNWNFLAKLKRSRAIEFLTSTAELDTAVPLGIKLRRQRVPWNFAAAEYVKVSPVKLDYAVNATNMFWRSTALALMEG